jgi:hypothetical protein
MAQTKGPREEVCSQCFDGFSMTVSIRRIAITCFFKALSFGEGWMRCFLVTHR